MSKLKTLSKSYKTVVMFVSNIKTNIYKIVTGYGFYVCIAFTVVLCFSAYIYDNSDNGDRYSVFTSLITFDRDFMLSSTSFSSVEVVRKGASGSWLSLFIPIISAFSFIPIVCDEYESKFVRFEIIRSSKKCYNMSKFITACLCGGFAAAVGFVLFALAVCAFFPDINEYEAELKQMYENAFVSNYPNIMQAGLLLIVIKKSGEMFLYGAVCAVPAITLTSIVKNKYLVLCIPFFIKYAVNQTCIKIQAKALADFNNVDADLMKIGSIINPDAFSYLSDFDSDKWIVLIYNGALVFAAATVYLVIQVRRFDSSE